MKQLDISMVLVGFNNEPIKSPDQKDLTIKDVLISTLHLVRVSNGKDAMAIHKLGHKIYDSKGTLELEDAEFELIEKYIDENPAQYFALIIGQVKEVLEGAKK